MRDLLLIAKSFALEAKAKQVELCHVLKAVPYVDIQGGGAVQFLLRQNGEIGIDPDLAVQERVARAEQSPRMALDGEVQQLVRRLTAAKAHVRMKTRDIALPAPLALARRVGRTLQSGIEGQPAMIEGVTTYLAGRGEETKGIKGVFIFAGPSASGKSLAARILAEGLGADYRLWEFDTSEIDSPIERFAFDGARSAFQGSRPGELTSFVRLNPKTVIVLDHFDRMNPAVQTFLLPLLESGVLKDGFGFFEGDDKNKRQIAPPEVDFSQCYLVINVEAGAELYESPALLDRLLQEGGESRVNAALVSALRAARNEQAQPPGPCFAAPVLSRLLADGIPILFRRLGWEALNHICRDELALASALFRERLGAEVEVVINSPEAITELLVLAEGGQVDARKIGREALVNRLFGPVLSHWLSLGTLHNRVVVDLAPPAGAELKMLRERLGGDPSRTLFRTMKRVDYDLTLELSGDALRVDLTNPRLAKIISGGDYQGPGALLVEAPDVTFADIAGMEHIKANLRSQAALLRAPDKLKAAGLRPPGGVLLYGGPGTGKTTLARAFAGEAGLPFIAVTAPELLDFSFQRVLFEKLRAYAPAVLFIDELDALGRRGDGANPAINVLLAQLDGFASRAGEPVFVIGATNFPQRVDPALLRPGRIELKFEVDAPGREARRMMLARVEEHVDSGVLDTLIDYASGMSGAQIEAACRQMVLAECVLDEHAARAALESVVFGERVENYASGMRETIAWHEAGHAVVLLRGGIGRVDYVSLTARENSAGHVWTSATERMAPGLRSTRTRLAATLAGRVAQRIRFGDEEGADAGDEQDLERATALAYQAVAHWGLDAEIGPMHLPGRDAGFGLPALGIRVEERVEAWMREAEQEARNVLEANWAAVEAVAQALLECGALAHDRLQEVVSLASKARPSGRQPRTRTGKLAAKTIPMRQVVDGMDRT